MNRTRFEYIIGAIKSSNLTDNDKSKVLGHIVAQSVKKYPYLLQFGDFFVTNNIPNPYGWAVDMNGNIITSQVGTGEFIFDITTPNPFAFDIGNIPAINLVSTVNDYFAGLGMEFSDNNGEYAFGIPTTPLFWGLVFNINGDFGNVELSHNEAYRITDGMSELTFDGHTSDIVEVPVFKRVVTYIVSGAISSDVPPLLKNILWNPLNEEDVSEPFVLVSSQVMDDTSGLSPVGYTPFTGEYVALGNSGELSFIFNLTSGVNEYSLTANLIVSPMPH